MNALRNEPGRRYQSVRDLADDIANHLAGRPVKAHPESVGYRARKTLANPWFFAPASAVLSLSALTGWALFERSAAVRARGAADDALAKVSNSLAAERVAREDADTNLALGPPVRRGLLHQG